jgi:hypothetical protein
MRDAKVELYISFFEKTKIGRPRLEDGSLAPIALGGRVLSGMEQKAGLAVFFFGCYRYAHSCFRIER